MRSPNCSTYIRVLVVLSAAALGTAACSPKVRNYGGGSGGVGEGGGGSGDGGADPAVGGGDGSSSNSSNSSGSGGHTAEPGRFQWALQIGENGYDSAVSVAVDPQGNPVVIGSFSGAIDLGGGPIVAPEGTAAYLAKFDRDGKHLWSKSFSLSLPAGQHVAHTSGGALFVGGSYFRNLDFGGGPLPETSGGLGLAKFESELGKHEWSKGFGDQYSKELSYVAVDASGAVLISGSIGGTADFGGGPIGDEIIGNAVYVAKLDAAGNHVFTKYIDDERAWLGAGGLAADAQGNVAVAGTFEQNFNLDPASPPLVSRGGNDIFFAMLAPDGALLWQKAFGNSLYDTASQVAFDATGNVFLAGVFQGSVDFGGGALVALGTKPNLFVAKFDPTGKHLFSRSFGDSERQDVASIAIDPSGNAVITGTFLGEIDLDGAVLTSKGTATDPNGQSTGGDIFIAKLGPGGEHLWSRQIGDPDIQSASGVAVGPAGGVFAVGSFRGTIDLGGGPVTTRGESDGYLVKLGP
ncbi:hypothetical protein WME99_03435 [Sorangium sp. So ce136]|uniref:hypothetical protein n=1 Tax=Sorangium sp. So ce136 TaxID=3133284 RepID=UPI003EFEB730